MTVYHEDVTSESLPLVIDLEAERFLNLVIDDETLESEREVVLEGGGCGPRTRPTAAASRRSRPSSQQAHPYRWPVIGWRSDVEQVTVEAYQRFFDTYYAANNLTLVIVGDFETEPTLAHIERAFGLPSARRAAAQPDHRRPPARRAALDVYFDAQLPLLFAGWHTPPTGHEDGEALDVASQILSGGRSSRLYRSLVYEQELALYAHGSYWEMSDAGMFYAAAGARPGVDLATLETAFMAEIEKVADEGVSEEKSLGRSGRWRSVSSIASRRITRWPAGSVGRSSPSGSPALSERIAAIRAVDREDVRVVSTYLTSSGRNVVRVMPPPVEPEVTATERRPRRSLRRRGAR